MAQSTKAEVKILEQALAKIKKQESLDKSLRKIITQLDPALATLSAEITKLKALVGESGAGRKETHVHPREGSLPHFMIKVMSPSKGITVQELLPLVKKAGWKTNSKTPEINLRSELYNKGYFVQQKQKGKWICQIGKKK